MTRLRLLFLATLSSAAPLLAQAPSAPDPFAPDQVLRIEVKMTPQDWRSLRIGHPIRDAKGVVLESSYPYFRGDVVINGVSFKQVGLRKKGGLGSSISTKPSLKIKFDEYVEGQAFSGIELMTLNTGNQDPLHVNQFLTYDLFRRAGAAAPRSGFAHVIVNGETLGVYTHVESISKPFLKRQFGNSNGTLYEISSQADFTEKAFQKIVEKSSGKNQDRIKAQELKKLLDSPEPVKLAEIEKLVDVDAFLKFWTAEVLIGHWDGYAGNINNTYVYLDSKTGRFYFIPWGTDQVFSGSVPLSVQARGKLCERLWELPEIRERYKVQMQRLLAGPWDEKRIEAEVERIRNLLAGFGTENPQIINPRIERIRTVLSNRRGNIQKELDAAPNWPALPVAQPAPPAASRPRLEVTGSFVAPWIDGAPPADPLQSGSAEIQFTLDGKQQPVTFTRYGAFVTRLAPAGMRPAYPQILITANDPASNKTWRISFIVDPVQIPDQGGEMDVNTYTVWAQLNEIVQGTPPQRKQGSAYGITGKLRVKEAVVKSGGRISGTFSITTPF